MKSVSKADYSGNILIISVYNISKERLILSIGLKGIIINWEKVKAIVLKGASGRTLNP